MNEEFQRFFEELPIGAAILSRDQKICDVNSAFVEFLGYSREELKGRSILELTETGERKEFGEELDQLYAGERDYLDFEACYIRKSGEQVWGYPVRVLHPNPAADEEDTMLMLIVDITQRRKLQEQMRHTERMSTLGMLAGSVAHDFNNILTVIASFVGLLEAEHDDSEMLDEAIEKIQTTVDRGQELTNQLLEFGRSEAPPMEVVDTNEFIRNFYDIFDRLLSPAIDLELSLTDDRPGVRLDAGRLHQVLTNLVINARDAIEESGTIRIETSLETAEELDLTEAVEDESTGYAHIQVCDDGPGISPEIISDVFEPYFTTKGEEGTGLGLTTVYGIVKEDKGFIRVDSRQGEGTCFDIYLPADEPNSTVEGTEDESR